MKDLNTISLQEKKYLIFDMDGTLIDSMGIWDTIDYQILRDFGGVDLTKEEIYQDRRNFFSRPQDKNIYLNYCEYLISKYHIPMSQRELLRIREEMTAHFLEENMEYKPGVKRVLKTLKELGFTLVLATTTTPKELTIYQTKNKKMKSQLDLKETFDLILTQQDVEHQKPNGEIYEKVLSHYQISPKECLAFEDSLHGILAANRVGIETVWVYDAHALPDRETIQQIADYKMVSFLEFWEEVLEKETVSLPYINHLIEQGKKEHKFSAKDISDTHHTFRILYQERAILFALVCNQYPTLAFKSKRHFEGTDPMFPGDFIAGIHTPKGLATFHLKLEFWDLFHVPELEKAPAYDGYSVEEGMNRLLSLISEEKIINNNIPKQKNLIE